MNHTNKIEARVSEKTDQLAGKMTTDQIGHAIMSELERAYAKHGRGQWGRHEFYAILKEEVDELWDDIKADAPQANLEKEAIQIAAMVFRYLETGDRYRNPETKQ